MFRAQTMKQLRRVHHYIGVFFTPAILLFSLSGALQTFRLQEEKGYGATPPSWIVWMASVHKDSSLPRTGGAAKEHGPAAKRADAPPKPPAIPRRSNLPLKIFVVLLSIGLILSSLLGVAIALNNRSTRRMSVLMLIAGAAVPLALLFV